MNRRIVTALVILAAGAAILEWCSCGSSSSSTPTPTSSTATAPTVSSVTGTTLGTTGATSSAAIATTGTTGVSGAASSQGALTVTFDTTMDGSTISNATLACGGTAESVTVSPTTNTTAYTITPSAALPQLSSCVLTLPATIKNSSGTAMAATTYTYTTGCSTNDDFSSDTLSTCWSASNSPTATVASNALSLSLSSASSMSLIGEYKTFGTDDITVTFSMPTFSGLTSNSDDCGLVIQDGTTEGLGLLFFLQPESGNLMAYNSTIAGDISVTTALLASSATSSTSLAGTLWYKVVQTGTSFATSYRIGDSGDFTALATTSLTFGATKKVHFIVGNDGTGTTNCQYSNFTVTGATATGPTYEY